MLMNLPKPAFPDEDLSDVVRSVFDIMVGLNVETEDDTVPTQEGILTAAVYMTGEQSGAVVIHCPASQACQFTGCFMGTEAPLSVNEEVLDVLGELANMVAGNIKSHLMPNSQLSIPSVIEGSDGILSLLWKNAERKMFNTEVGAFWVSITIAQTPEQERLTAIQARAAELARRSQ